MKQVSHMILVLLIFLIACKRQDEEPQQIKHIVLAASGEVDEKMNEFRSLLRHVNSAQGTSSEKRNIWTNFPYINAKTASKLPARTKGFGAVFTNVDSSNATTLELFNGAMSLGQYIVPNSSDTNKLSFIGVYLPDQMITHIKVTHRSKLNSNKNVTTNHGRKDSVVLLDIIY
jgi:hypothetical protein